MAFNIADERQVNESTIDSLEYISTVIGLLNCCLCTVAGNGGDGGGDELMDGAANAPMMAFELKRKNYLLWWIMDWNKLEKKNKSLCWWESTDTYW